MLRTTLTLALCLCLLAPASAGGATASSEGGTLVFRAAAGERNDLEVVVEPGGVRVSDALPLTPGPGCGPTPAPNTVTCLPSAGADVELGDGVDSAVLDRALGAVVRGGSGTDDIQSGGLLLGEGGDDILSARSGADVLVGADGDDQLFGGPGEDRLEPGRGRDIVQSGTGDDTVRARDGSFDRISCGGGSDDVTLDGLDFPGDTCFQASLDRRGAPRPLPLEGVLAVNGRLRAEVACPADAKRTCRGMVTALLGRKRIGRARFRVARGTHGASGLRTNRRQRRKIRRSTRFGLYSGRFTLIVRSRGRTVRMRVPLDVEGR